MIDFEICYSYNHKLKEMYDDFWKDLANKDINHFITYTGEMEEDPKGLFILAKIEGKTVGFTRINIYNKDWCTERNAEIIDIYIKPEYRNQGIGTALIAKVEELVSWNYDCHKLRIAYIEGNQQAGDLYKRLGYKKNFTELIKEV